MNIETPLGNIAELADLRRENKALRAMRRSYLLAQVECARVELRNERRYNRMQDRNAQNAEVNP